MSLDLDPLRLTVPGDRPVRSKGRYVLYWMIAQRRPTWNHALQHAVARARELDRPLLVLEPLDCTYRWACDRFHTFILQGMADNRRAFGEAGITYLPYVEPTEGAGRGLLAALAEHACLVITDEHPGYRWPSLVSRAAARLDTRIEAVDGCGVLPLRLADKGYKRAVDFRRFLHKTFASTPPAPPHPEPLVLAPQRAAELPDGLLDRWPAADLDALLAPSGLDDLPIDHGIPPVPERPGGPSEAEDRLQRFMRRLGSYVDRNHPDEDASSGLSPWLHFGHIGGARVVHAILDREAWSSDQMAPDRFAKQEGAWGLSEGAEAFLEEVITWRELAHQAAFLEGEDFERYRGLPDWARKTLDEHRDDPREAIYDLETLARAESADALWNAAQRELVHSGVMHNYLRMLWGKRVLAWTESPERCFEVLVELNNRYALDGRDPNSYAGIGWVLGRFDRAWGPERPIYGKIRYMTSQSTRRKLRLSDWLERWSA